MIEEWRVGTDTRNEHYKAQHDMNTPMHHRREAVYYMKARFHRRSAQVEICLFFIARNLAYLARLVPTLAKHVVCADDGKPIKSNRRQHIPGMGPPKLCIYYIFSRIWGIFCNFSFFLFGFACKTEFIAALQAVPVKFATALDRTERVCKTRRFRSWGIWVKYLTGTIAWFACT